MPGATRWRALPGADGGRIYAESLWVPCVGIHQFCEAEKKIELLPSKERQRVCLEVEIPMLRDFGCWLEKLAEQPLASKLKTAVEYALK